jgi:hypothetical protein
MAKAWIKNLGGAVALSLGLPGFSVWAQESAVQNAILEGVQISSDKGEKPAENVVTCYFIFIDKPSSYFYEIRRKPNRLVFEFNDTKKGTAPIASISEPPISGFDMEETRVDVNKDVKGLTPEWHDVLRIRFSLDQIPQVTVADEYNVISFKYKWTNDPSKIKSYVQSDRSPLVFWGSAAGLTAAGGGVLAYYFLKPKGSTEVPPIPTDDLPTRPPDPTKP